MRRFAICLLFLLTPALAFCAASAQATTVIDPLGPPPGLAPGAVYQRVFVTSVGFDVDSSNSYPPGGGTFGGLAGADFDVTLTAFQAGLIPDWDGVAIPFHAILSDGMTNARDRLDIQGPIYNMQNELIATGAADLWDGTLAHAIRYDEFGNSAADGTRVWTGTQANGNGSGNTANNWLNPNGFALLGDPTSIGNSWIFATSDTSNSSHPLYALSPPLTVVPEPSSAALAGLGLMALVGARIRRLRRAE